MGQVLALARFDPNPNPVPPPPYSYLIRVAVLILAVHMDRHTRTSLPHPAPATERDRLQSSADAMYTASLQERMLGILTQVNGNIDHIPPNHGSDTFDFELSFGTGGAEQREAFRTRMTSPLPINPG